jgi:type I restriction enzyme S subunit
MSDDAYLGSLPAGWQVNEIGSVSEFIRGVTYQKSDAHDRPGAGLIPLLRATNIGDERISFSDFVFIPKKKVKPEQMIQLNDLVIAASSGSSSVVGKSAPVLTNYEATFGAFCGVLRPTEQISPNYFRLYIQSPVVRDTWSALARGTNINNLKKEQVVTTKIPVPPLAEQEVIARLIDAQLLRLDAALMSVRAVREKANMLRRSLLHAAFTGALTGHDTSAGSLPQGWSIKSLSQICGSKPDAIVDGPFGSNLKRSHFQTSGIPVLKIQNVKPNEIVQKNLDYVTPVKFDELRRHTFVRGDIIMTKLGDPLGVCGIVEDLEHGVIVADLVRIRPSDTNVKFVCYQLNSPSIAQTINEGQKGVTRPRVNLSTIRNLNLAIPPRSEQDKIVEILDAQLSRLDAAMVAVWAVREKVSRLRRSLLHAAFTGALTGHDTSAGSLPPDWVQSELGKVARWGSGGTPKSGTAAYYGGDIPWAVIGDLTETWVTKTNQTITEVGLNESSAKLIQRGTVMLAMYGASIGRTGIAGREMATNQAIAFAVPKSDVVDVQYLLKYLQSQKDAFVRAGQGGAQPNISQTVIKPWPIPTPPLAEQQEIVEILDAQLSRLDATLIAVNTIEARVTSLRRSLLHAAFTGELTKAWREGPHD